MGIMGMRLSKSKHGSMARRSTPSPVIHVLLESHCNTETTRSQTPEETCMVIENQETDALYDAYQEYIAESIAHHEACVLNPRSNDKTKEDVEVEDVTCYIQTVSERPKVQKVPNSLPTVGKSYIDSMKKLAKMRCSGEKKKATGVTRRLMEEVMVAKENMFIYQRLVKISPSEDVSRRIHRKEFTKSRYLLDKMSRYECAPYGAAIHLNRVPWIDNF